MREGFNPNRQKGAVLAVSLIILLIMTIIGLQGMSSTTLEERMSRNYRDSQLSFQAAETALRDAENLVQSTAFNLANYDASCTNGLCFNGTSGACPAVTPATPHWVGTTVWSDPTKYKVYTGSITGVIAKPKYIIEFRCYVQTNPSLPEPTTTPGTNDEWSEMYRITALGFGASDTSRTMLQSTYKKPL